jgi:hypothetical protein
MSICHTRLFFVFLLATTNQSFAQSISKDYQKNCVLEQVAEHQGVQGKALTEEDFVGYCNCQAEFISKNASNRQVNELVMNPKVKPEWLKTIELTVMKACIAVDSKSRT